MATQREFPITSGPSKFDLMISLFHSGNHQRPGVYFQLDNPGVSGAEVYVMIDQIQREDGSGESWNISGTLLSFSPKGELKFKAYFSTKSRTGRIKFID